ncbi:MAG TPA: class I SAM-dependent methyltransferase [Holophagaceae bacterium]|nr:class I SAM-dependent methyltransferase [Holophagaceae bacterium]
MRSHLSIDEATTPSLHMARELLHERHRFSRDIIDRGAEAFGRPWIEGCEATLARLFPTREALALALKGYAAFAFDALRRQKAFELNPVYPAKSHQEASEEVYLNEAFMMGQYLPGLLLSHYFWPHHFRQLRFFEIAFAEALGQREAPRFAEVGIGTGLYSRLLLQGHPEARGLGYDISPASKAFTESHLRAFGLSERYEVELRDVVARPIEPVAHLVCVEVLEHLEDPLAFLRTLRAALLPGGRAFITAALDAPNADHIYLYRKPDEVLTQLLEAGFTLEQSWVGAAHAPAALGLPVPLAAAFVVS